MNSSYRFGRFIFRAIFATYFRWRVFGAEQVPMTGGVILAANHSSFIDPPLIGCGTERIISMLARESLFRFPLMGIVLRSWCVVPVDRDGGGAKGLKIVMDRLLAGQAIALFPEGTRTTDGNLQPARSGIGLTVIKSTAPVVPVRIFGAFEAYGRHLLIPRPRRVILKFGKPLHFKNLRTEAKSCDKPRLKQIYQEIADEIMVAIAKLEPMAD